MNRSCVLLAATLMGPCLSASALDTIEVMRKAKAYAVPETTIRDPFFHDPAVAAQALPDLVPRADHGVSAPRNACDRNSGSLCYDAKSRQVVYRPIRRYMPTVDGLTPENISVKRGSIVFKYSFR